MYFYIPFKLNENSSGIQIHTVHDLDEYLYDNKSGILISTLFE